MKLVLKHKDSIKLYSLEMDYDTLVHFICKEFMIRPDTLELSFLDEEEDNISILSNDDIEVMTSLFEGKDYVKVQVLGEVQEVQEQVKQCLQKKVQSPVVEVQEEKGVKVQIEPVESILKEQIAQENKVEQNKKEEINVQEIPKQKEEENGQKRECWRKRKWQKMQTYLNEKVADLVDQRLKALLPCLKQQLLSNEKKIEIIDDTLMIHENHECKACLMKPIKGVRYSCLTCANFNLCQACETKVDHEHNLLKIKKIVNKEQDKNSFKSFFSHQESSPEDGKQKYKGHHRHHYGHHGGHHRGKWFKKAQGLSIMFGGQFEDYSTFIRQHHDLNPRQTYKQYALLKKISQEEFKNLFIQYRCQKLANLFGKPPATYLNVVQEKFELKYSDLLKYIYEKGIQAEPYRKDECRWKKQGRKWNFNEECHNEKIQKYQEKKVEIKVQEKIEQSIKKVQQKKSEVVAQVIKKEEQKPKENISLMITDSILQEPQPLDVPEVVRQKGKILLLLKEIFGDQDAKKYMKFIDKHYKEGGEAIIARWIEQSHN